MVTLEAIMREFPGCASVCDELKTIDYELRQEVEGMIPEDLCKSQVITQASRMFLSIFSGFMLLLIGFMIREWSRLRRDRYQTSLDKMQVIAS
jgi:hypothetical protein